MSLGHVFQSSPAPRGGCNARCWMTVRRSSAFQSSPAPRGGCNAMLDTRHALGAMDTFQSSPAPRGGCNRDVSHRQPSEVVSRVSILTRPERRMQRHVVRRATGKITCPRSFQSSPAPRGGCNLRTLSWDSNPCSLGIEFQSSPAPRGGCNGRQGL